jgi:hypothetical protein
MTTNDVVPAGEWSATLEELDRAVGRLAMLCRVPILQRGVIDRVLANDRSRCSSDNLLAFAKLRDLLLMQFALQRLWAVELGESYAAAIESYVIARLRYSLPELAATWPPA